MNSVSWNILAWIGGGSAVEPKMLVDGGPGQITYVLGWVNPAEFNMKMRCDCIGWVSDMVHITDNQLLQSIFRGALLVLVHPTFPHWYWQMSRSRNTLLQPTPPLWHTATQGDWRKVSLLWLCHSMPEIQWSHPPTIEVLIHDFACLLCTVIVVNGPATHQVVAEAAAW